jgi:hypothetical protein
MNRLVVPRLREAGFAFVVDENATRWKEGEYFRRSKHAREQVIRIGSKKFGGALGLNVVAQQPDGSYKYLRWHEQGLEPADLRYSNQDELDAALLRIIYFLETQGFPWLDSQTAQG